MPISVAIITRNRAALLDRCLNSIVNQAVSPKEVVIVDNDSIDHTRSVIARYKKMLPIRYTREYRIGIPYARNTGITIAKGDIVAFLDDDCIAGKDWIASIVRFFQKHTRASGVIGRTMSASPLSIPALVESAYVYRWLLKHIENPNKIAEVHSGTFVDFKNAAFRGSDIKKFRFATNVPFGDVGNEDTEIGVRMLSSRQIFFYDPSITVAHRYSPTLTRLFLRNFWSGFSDKLLLRSRGIDVRKSHRKQVLGAWMAYCLQIIQSLSVEQKVIFFLLVFIYPLASRAGRVTAEIFWKLKLPTSIPQR